MYDKHYVIQADKQLKKQVKKIWSYVAMTKTFPKKITVKMKFSYTPIADVTMLHVHKLFT
jgi:hypothetical protein